MTPHDQPPERGEPALRLRSAGYGHAMSFEEIARVIETAVVSDNPEVLSQLRVNLALMWPMDADAELLGGVISRRLERLRQPASSKPAGSDVIVLNTPSREPSMHRPMVRPMGVPDSLDGVTLRSIPWSAERIPAPALADRGIPARSVWRVIAGGAELPPLTEPEGGFPRGSERAAILRHIGEHLPDL